MSKRSRVRRRNLRPHRKLSADRQPVRPSKRHRFLRSGRRLHRRRKSVIRRRPLIWHRRRRAGGVKRDRPPRLPMREAPRRKSRKARSPRPNNRRTVRVRRTTGRKIMVRKTVDRINRGNSDRNRPYVKKKRRPSRPRIGNGPGPNLSRTWIRRSADAIKTYSRPNSFLNSVFA